MKCYPDNMKNLIVAIVSEEKFNWYVADKEIWFLDYRPMLSWKERITQAVFIDDDIRKNDIYLVHTKNSSEFLKRLKPFRTDTKELREVVKLEEQTHPILDSRLPDDYWTFDFRPSLYINFDKKIFISSYSENISYENYTPKNWKKRFGDFLECIPDDKKYWIDDNGHDIIYRERGI